MEEEEVKQDDEDDGRLKRTRPRPRQGGMNHRRETREKGMRVKMKQEKDNIQDHGQDKEG